MLSLCSTAESICWVIDWQAEEILRWLCLTLQFELECRPFYIAGFNAHDLVPKSLATPSEHKTEGESLRLTLTFYP